MADSPWWDWDAEKEAWGWARAPPVSQKTGGGATATKGARKKVRITVGGGVCVIVQQCSS